MSMIYTGIQFNAEMISFSLICRVIFFHWYGGHFFPIDMWGDFFSLHFFAFLNYKSNSFTFFCKIILKIKHFYYLLLQTNFIINFKSYTIYLHKSLTLKKADQCTCTTYKKKRTAEPFSNDNWVQSLKWKFEFIYI